MKAKDLATMIAEKLSDETPVEVLADEILGVIHEAMRAKPIVVSNNHTMVIYEGDWPEDGAHE